MKMSYDIIVVGAGHAGCEAAYAGAVMGSSTLLISMDLTKVAQMSCNPAIGGIAKGQIVREVDALGGAMGFVTDASTIQFRMLNQSKGPAMWSPRAQCDRMLYSATMRSVLESLPLLDLWQDQVSSLIFDKDSVVGVRTQLGASFYARSIILTAGTFLNGRLYIGLESTSGGRIGEPAADGLSDQLRGRGLVVDRMKTGTPPRIDGRSIDLTQLQKQLGDDTPNRFSFLNVPSAVQSKGHQLSCYMVYTNPSVHEMLRTGFDRSPLFTGRIHGKGPRYCPSIEDKLRTFADKDQHPLFLEPEGWNTCEFYLQGFSSSLPLDVQFQAVRKIQGLENAKFLRPAYAIEYDYFPPTQISHSLEVKNVPNLFFAGQINGTTGYEEAAAQGLMAGINAHLKGRGLPPFLLSRDQAYIGVLIDDLVTKGVDEPYRMFTSRAEYRILLRQDNADERLTRLSYTLGLAQQERIDYLNRKISFRDSLLAALEETSVEPDLVNDLLNRVGTSPITQKKRLSDLLSRPQLSFADLVHFVPRGTFNEQDPLYNEVCESAEILVKYKGYIERESAFADKILRLDKVLIPASFDFMSMNALSTEARQKLQNVKPKTIGQASRIPGVSPADISVLLLFLGR